MVKTEKPVLIRQIEADILEVLKTGVDNTGEVSLKLNAKYSSIHSVLGRMVMFNLVNKPRKGVYMPNIDSYEVGSDQEVTGKRRNKENLYENMSELPEDMVEILIYIKLHLESGVYSRSKIYKNLRSQGLSISKYDYNELIRKYKLAPIRKPECEDIA